MDTLLLAQLPSENSAEARGYRRVRNEGFVDEAVVFSVIKKGPYERVFVKSEDMVLSSSQDDYAGWALPVASPFRSLMNVETPAAPAVLKLPAAPSLDGVRKFSEPGLSEPHRGSHRWWLFGVTGAMTCGIFSLTLLSLAQRAGIEKTMASHMPTPRRAEATKVVTAERESAPALVKVLPGR